MKRAITFLTLAGCMVALAGCGGAKFTVPEEPVELELGSALSENVADYIIFTDRVSEERKQEILDTAALDFSKVNTEEPGEYQAGVTYGNTEYAFTIKVQDTTAPEGTLASEVAKLTTGEPVEASELVTSVADAQNVAVQFVVPSEKEAGGEELVDRYTYESAGDYEITIRLTDASGNTSDLLQKVTVINPDITAPELTGVRNRTVYVGGIIDYKKGVTVWDDLDGDLTEQLTIDSTDVNLEKEGTYIVAYKVSDHAGNETVKKAKITVTKKPTVAPTQTSAQPQEAATGQENRSSHSSGSHSDSGNSDNGGSQSQGGQESVGAAETEPSKEEAASATTETPESTNSDSSESTDTPTWGVKGPEGTPFGGLPLE